MKSLQALYEEILKSKDLQKEFAELKDEDEVIAFLKKNDCNAKFDELMKFLQTKLDGEGKVTDKELGEIGSGGKPSSYIPVKVSLISSKCSTPAGCVMFLD